MEHAPCRRGGSEGQRERGRQVGRRVGGGEEGTNGRCEGENPSVRNCRQRGGKREWGTKRRRAEQQLERHVPAGDYWQHRWLWAGVGAAQATLHSRLRTRIYVCVQGTDLQAREITSATQSAACPSTETQQQQQQQQAQPGDAASVPMRRIAAQRAHQITARVLNELQRLTSATNWGSDLAGEVN